MRRAIVLLMLLLLSIPMFAVERRQSFKVLPQELFTAALRLAHQRYKVGLVNGKRMQFSYKTSVKSTAYVVKVAARPQGSSSSLVLNISGRAKGPADADRVAEIFFQAVKMELEASPVRIG